ncbi:MAG: hypothetical protein M1812_004956 [Candelaria pacifica]|nr:MAG: hypothetical protein M1812_004956 [Candelaria pacifica]
MSTSGASPKPLVDVNHPCRILRLPTEIRLGTYVYCIPHEPQILGREPDTHKSIPYRLLPLAVEFVLAYPEAEEEFNEMLLKNCFLSFLPTFDEVCHVGQGAIYRLMTAKTCRLAHDFFDTLGTKQTTWVRHIRLRMVFCENGETNGSQFYEIANVIRRCLLELDARALPETLKVRWVADLGAVPSYYQPCYVANHCRNVRFEIATPGQKRFLLDIEAHRLPGGLNPATCEVFSSCLEAALKRTPDGLAIGDRMS